MDILYFSEMWNDKTVHFHCFYSNAHILLLQHTPKTACQDKFNSDEIKRLYAKRWRIETSFRELKYTLGLTRFHSKKPEYIMQEIWSRIALYNFCEIIATNVVINEKKATNIHISSTIPSDSDLLLLSINKKRKSSTRCRISNRTWASSYTFWENRPSQSQAPVCDKLFI